MFYLEKSAAIGGAIVAAGAYLRWAVVPVIAAFDLGRSVGKVAGRRNERAAVVAAISEIQRQRNT